MLLQRPVAAAIGAVGRGARAGRGCARRAAAGRAWGLPAAQEGTGKAKGRAVGRSARQQITGAGIAALRSAGAAAGVQEPVFTDLGRRGCVQKLKDAGQGRDQECAAPARLRSRLGSVDSAQLDVRGWTGRFQACLRSGIPSFHLALHGHPPVPPGPNWHCADCRHRWHDTLQAPAARVGVAFALLHKIHAAGHQAGGSICIARPSSNALIANLYSRAAATQAMADFIALDGTLLASGDDEEQSEGPVEHQEEHGASADQGEAAGGAPPLSPVELVPSYLAKAVAEVAAAAAAQERSSQAAQQAQAPTGEDKAPPPPKWQHPTAAAAAGTPRTEEEGAALAGPAELPVAAAEHTAVPALVATAAAEASAPATSQQLPEGEGKARVAAPSGDRLAEPPVPTPDVQEGTAASQTDTAGSRKGALLPPAATGVVGEAASAERAGAAAAAERAGQAAAEERGGKAAAAPAEPAGGAQAGGATTVGSGAAQGAAADEAATRLPLPVFEDRGQAAPQQQRQQQLQQQWQALHMFEDKGQAALQQQQPAAVPLSPRDPRLAAAMLRRQVQAASPKGEAVGARSGGGRPGACGDRPAAHGSLNKVAPASAKDEGKAAKDAASPRRQ